jgi:hypothetical protein
MCSSCAFCRKKKNRIKAEAKKEAPKPEKTEKKKHVKIDAAKETQNLFTKIKCNGKNVFSIERICSL